MAGETTVVSPWPQQIFSTDEHRGVGGDALKARTFGISQQLAEGFGAERVKDAHIEVLREAALTRKDISDLRYAVYTLSEKVTAQGMDTKLALMESENRELRDRLRRRRGPAV